MTGVVIQDATYNGTIGSEFVWIPVGEIKKSESETIVINLSRYSFGSSIDEDIEIGDSIIEDYYQEMEDLADFKLKASAEISGGYYIGRYEARVDNATLDSSEISYQNYTGSDTMWTGYAGGVLVTKATSPVWNYITKNKAAEVSKNMYKGTTFTSELINSYAWDTAIAFIQKSNNKKYTVNGTGTGASQEEKCKIWDLYSNCAEFTTENRKSYNSSDAWEENVARSGCIRYEYYNSQNVNYATSANSLLSFRPILFL